MVVPYDLFGVGCAGGEAGVFFLPPCQVEGCHGTRSPLAMWKAVENTQANMKYQKTARCSLILTSQDSWESTFFHFSFTQSESICQCGSTVQEKDLINSGI